MCLELYNRCMLPVTMRSLTILKRIAILLLNGTVNTIGYFFCICFFTVLCFMVYFR